MIWVVILLSDEPLIDSELQNAVGAVLVQDAFHSASHRPWIQQPQTVTRLHD